MSIELIIALIVMVKFNPVVGVLGLLVAYELMRRSSISNSNILLRQEVPSEKYTRPFERFGA